MTYISHMSAVELCAGAGGMALGLEGAAFGHEALVEVDINACATLRLNRKEWRVRQQDVRELSGAEWKGVDLVAAGFPCPPYSIAGGQLGADDPRDLFGHGLNIIEAARPSAVMIENVRGILSPKFASVRQGIRDRFWKMGYTLDWQVLNARDFGVSQNRARVIFVALCHDAFQHFRWPAPIPFRPLTVGKCLGNMMGARGWEGANAWENAADGIAPTLVGGSKLHGGADLGPTRARASWAALGVNGVSVADMPPEPGFVGRPKLTVKMAAKLQGFPDFWDFCGKKTAQYRQVGNAFPPPVSFAVASQVHIALEAAARARVGPRHSVGLPLAA